MNFILAPDSFKESMTALQACNAMEAGIKKVMPSAICQKIPLADGGEGTLHTLISLTGGVIYKKEVTGPLVDKVFGEYGILGDGKTGVIELASASGLHLVSPDDRNPLYTTTFGTGELIKEVLQHGITKLIIGLGGSATNDGGVGLLQALGIQFLNKEGLEIGWGGKYLIDMSQINTENLILNNIDLEIEVACDVTNSLTGELGATQIYGPQKGASPEMILDLEKGLAHFADKIKEYTGKEVALLPGAGAAGGTGAGLMAFLDATFSSGISLIIKYSGLEEKIKMADYIFTGEGSIDKQTLNGKTIAGVVKLAQKYNKPVIAFAGRISDSEALYQTGLTAIFSILPGIISLEDALKNGEKNLENTVEAVVKVIKKSSE